MEVAVVGQLVGAGAVGIDHPDLVGVADISLIDNAAVGGPSEPVHSVHSAGCDLRGGVRVTRGTNREIDVDVALDRQERAGIGGYTERDITVHVAGDSAYLPTALRIPIDLLGSAGFFLRGDEYAAAVGKPANIVYRPPMDRRKRRGGTVAERDIQQVEVQAVGRRIANRNGNGLPSGAQEG